MEIGHDVIAMFEMNKPQGFDCPGCAWPDPKHYASFDICENGAKAMSWEATSKRTTPEFFAKHSVTELLKWDDYDLENEGRLTHPMKYNPQTDHYEVIEWEEAFAQIGKHLSGYADLMWSSFIPLGAPQTKLRFYINCLQESTERIISLIVPICAMNQRVLDLLHLLGWVRALCYWKTLIKPI